MIQGQAIDLFKLQSELVDMKVDMAVSRSIDRVIDQIHELRNDVNAQIHELRDNVNSQIHGLKHEMNTQIHELRHEMRDGFVSMGTRISAVETRVTAVETKLGIINEPRKEIRNRFIDYCFKAGWLILGATVSYLALMFHSIS